MPLFMAEANSRLLRLDSHPSARNKAVSIKSLPAGTTLFSCEPLATVLIESAKGKRCDSCLFETHKLQRCTGCRLYWYCDVNCQLKAWKTNHKRICTHVCKYMKDFNSATFSIPLHSLLLAHLLAEHEQSLKSAFDKVDPRQACYDSNDAYDPILALLTLLPSNEDTGIIQNIPISFQDHRLASYVSLRFARNNFTIHSSRMDVVGHGVFPVASRLFNHSCFPNAVPIYHVTRALGVRMHIQLLRGVSAGEEITIPYIDPALPFVSRQARLRDTYNFVCDCSLCQPPFNELSGTISTFENTLRLQVIPLIYKGTRSFESTAMSVRRDLLKDLPMTYLPNLSEEFSRASHMGPYDVAVERGTLLLALYCLLYPMYFPMIGLHALELAKTAWNLFVTDSKSAHILDVMKHAIQVANDTFEILYGSEVLEKERSSKAEEVVAELQALRELFLSEIQLSASQGAN